MARRITLALALALALTAPVAVAQAVETETLDPGNATVTLTLHPFLAKDEVDMLRNIGSTPGAIEMMVGDTKNFGAIAASPDEGFLRDGLPVASAVAVAQKPDAQSARAAAVAECQAVAKSRKPCVPILEIAPRQ